MKYKIKGVKKLEGVVNISGSKNASLPILAASILNGKKSTIYNLPDIKDVKTTLKILELLGCKIEKKRNKVIIDSSNMDKYIVPHDLMRELRSSVILAGSIIGRFKKATFSYPGGCEIGTRPIDLHIENFKKIGINIEENAGYIVCNCDKIKSAEVHLEFPSVGATENIILASILSDAEVIITNADNVYCIEYGQLLTGNMTYDRVARIVIRGWKATFYDEDGNEVGQTDHYYNNRLAAILTPNSYFPYFPEDCFRNRSEYTVGYGREQGQIVDWIEDDEMLDLTAIAQSTPGAMAVNASVLVGYRMAGIPGACITVLATVLPPFLILSVISLFYAQFRDNWVVNLVLRGMQAGVAAVICDVVVSMSQNIFKLRRILPVIMLAGVNKFINIK